MVLNLIFDSEAEALMDRLRERMAKANNVQVIISALACYDLITEKYFEGCEFCVKHPDGSIEVVKPQ